jgi:hypothetical protein
MLFGLCMASPALTSVAPAAAQATTVSFSTAELAPADAIGYIVSTTDEQSEQWQLADTLLDRAGLGAALDELAAEELTDESGQNLPLDAFLGGEVGVVLYQSALETLAAESMAGADMEAMLEGLGMETPEADTGEETGQGFAIVLDARAPDTAWTGIRDSLQERTNEESTYEGTTILYAPPSSDSEEGMAAAQVGDHVLIGLAPQDLHPLIDTANGTTESITTLPEFTQTQDALPQDFLMFAFFTAIDPSQANFGPFAGFANQLATESFFGVTIAADEPGFRMETVEIPASGETLPAGAANFTSELVEIAPADTLLFLSAGDLGATGVLDAIGATFIALALGMGDPSAAPDPNQAPEEFIAAQYEAAAAMIGINLQTEFFQQFEGEYGGWLAADADTQTLSGLFATGLGDPERVANALTQLSFLVQGATGGETPLTTREVGGGEVFVIELGDEAGSTLEFGVVGDHLVIGAGDAVDRFGGDAGDALSADPQFQAVMETLPAERNGLFYLDLARAIPLGQMAAEASEDMGMGFDSGPDANEACADYATQEEAQAAYDAGESGTFDLDQDFDGEVCEDFFAAGETTDAGSDPAAALADVDYSAIKAIAMASHSEGDMRRSSAILYIQE